MQNKPPPKHTQLCFLTCCHENVKTCYVRRPLQLSSRCPIVPSRVSSVSPQTFRECVTCPYLHFVVNFSTVNCRLRSSAVRFLSSINTKTAAVLILVHYLRCWLLSCEYDIHSLTTSRWLRKFVFGRKSNNPLRRYHLFCVCVCYVCSFVCCISFGKR